MIRQLEDDALQSGPRKRHVKSDPLMHNGRHFGRAIFAFCNFRTLIANGLLLNAENPDPETLSAKERREYAVFRDLLKLCHGLEKRLLDSSEGEIGIVADLLQKGASASRADDTKGLKSAVIDWITPSDGVLNPPLSRKIKSNRGFKHKVTGALLCPTNLDWASPDIQSKLASGEMQVRGDQWPKFLYPDLNYDPEDPWRGLLRSQLLVSAFKHVFMSPSSVDADDSKATKGGNARIHGMTAVTSASIVYIACQVRFALCAASTFSRSDTVMDSENFYHSLLDTLEDVDERENLQELLRWWNKKIFPHSAPERVLAPIEGSALQRIRQKRAEAKAAQASTAA